MNGSDFDDMYRIFIDPNVLKSFSLDSFSKEQMKEWIDRNLFHQNKYGYGLFPVILKSTEELIGDCGLEHSDFNGKPCVELGYDLISKYWNQGYATEAAIRIRDYAITELEINRDSICSFIRQTNVASQRVSEKIGMHRILEFEKYETRYFLYGFAETLFE